MNFFDLFFPDQAQASHLRKLVEQGEQKQSPQVTNGCQACGELEQRIEDLEEDLWQAGLAIEALLEVLEQSGLVNRKDLAVRARQIDARDQEAITPAPLPKSIPIRPSRPWPGTE